MSYNNIQQHNKNNLHQSNYYLTKFKLDNEFYLFTTHTSQSSSSTFTFTLITANCIYTSHTLLIPQLQPASLPLSNINNDTYTNYIINSIRTQDTTGQLYKYVLNNPDHTSSTNTSSTRYTTLELLLYKVTETGSISIPICYASISLYQSSNDTNGYNTYLNTMYKILQWSNTIKHNINTTESCNIQHTDTIQQLHELLSSECCQADTVKQNTLQHCADQVNRYKLQIKQLQQKKNKLIEQRDRLQKCN